MSLLMPAPLAPSLYASARYLRVGRGADRVRLCIARLASLSSTTRRRALLVHGNPSHLDHWRGIVPALRRHAEVLAYDQPGFGSSDAFDDDRPTLERSARVALALLDELGWEAPVDVIGHSHGAMVALAVAALAPARVAGIVLVGTGGPTRHRAYRQLALPGVDRLLRGAGEALRLAPRVARFVVERVGREAYAPDRCPADEIDAEVRLLASRPAILRSMARLAADDPCRKVGELAHHVRTPLLFVHGTEDALVPPGHARQLFEILRQENRDARFVPVPGGHMVHVTRPHVVAGLVAEWLDR